MGVDFAVKPAILNPDFALVFYVTPGCIPVLISGSPVYGPSQALATVRGRRTESKVDNYGAGRAGGERVQ